MRTLLNALITELQSATGLSGVRDRDISTAPTVNYLPDGVKGSAITLVPGSSVRAERPGNMLDVIRTARVVLWVNMLKPQDTTDAILALSEAVDELLHDNFLGLPAMEAAFCRTISDPTVFGSKKEYGRFIVRLIMDYQYESEEEAPDNG